MTTSILMPPAAPTQPGRGPILLLGVMNRCGSNHLGWLLSRHPGMATAAAGNSGEDYLLKRADLLAEYADDTVRHWSAEGRDALANGVMSAIGDGLLEAMRGDAADDQRLLLRTPRVFALDQAARLFPSATMVLLMRDGREVVASAEKTFDPLPDGEWERRWRGGADLMWEISQGQAEGAAPLPWLLVRFEDLVADARATLERLLDALGLDRDAYPWDELDTAPVIGSSAAKPDARSRRWTPIDKPAGFRPSGRWHDWSPARRRRFDRLCGPAMARWGYGPATPATLSWLGRGLGRGLGWGFGWGGALGRRAA
ncbi:MAG: sulfotransferase [Planctomycetota bacterium]